MKMHRRQFLSTAVAGLASSRLAGDSAEAAPAVQISSADHPFLTAAHDFEDVSRGDPKPQTLRGEALLKARLTPETWQLELVADEQKPDYIKEQASIGQPITLDYAALQELGRKHAVRFIKAMQCLNIPYPLGQGLWEGVPLRDVLRLAADMKNVRRIFYWGFHNDDPQQMFRSSLSYAEVMETPPGELPVFLAYRLNGEPLPLERGGPVRMVVPWAHGFKSVKWLQRIVLTNDYKANDTYAERNNDPESHLKTAAYLDDVPKELPAGQPVAVKGLAISGWSGLLRVETWLRPTAAEVGNLAANDPAWAEATWTPAQLGSPPRDWSAILPSGISPREILGFDAKTGQPLSWPLRYSMVSWSANLGALPAGTYEVRARAVDLNGFAQPEPRPSQQSGKNAVPVRRFKVV